MCHRTINVIALITTDSMQTITISRVKRDAPTIKTAIHTAKKGMRLIGTTLMLIRPRIMDTIKV